MSAVGPELPPHLLAKRKRQQEEDTEDEAATASGAKSPDESEKRRRVIGPAMPPAPLGERPVDPVSAQEEDSDSDDDFGPALPTSGADKQAPLSNDSDNSVQDGRVAESAPSEKLRRDDWMTMPPQQDDLAARMDPTKQRARGFNTGKGAKGPSARGDDSSAWNETPEQKRKRLQDEMMGVAKPASPGPQKAGRSAKGAREEAADAKTREQVEKARGPSLMERHTGSTGKDVDDDPSKRAFDREKDMGSGVRIGHTQRKDLLNKAAGFSSKFSGGSYL